MTHAKSIGAVTLALALALTGCLREEKIREEMKEATRAPEYLDTVPRSIADFVPHRPETTWTYYAGINARPSAQFRSDQTVDSRSATRGVFRYVTEFAGSDIRAFEEYIIRDNAMYIVRSGDDRGGDSSVRPMKPLLRFPAKQDSSWTWEGYGRTMAGDVEHTSYFRVDTGVSIETRAGHFKVIRVEETQVPHDPVWRGYRISVVSLYASGYGLVKQISQVVTPDGRRTRVEIELADSSLLKGKAKPKAAS
jgi:hypothetical protein